MGERPRAPVPQLLIVDGHPTVRRVMARLFTLRGWGVRAAASVAEALQELERSPDCVVLELDLPDGAGERVLEAAIAKGLQAETLIVTADEDQMRLAAVEQRFRPAGIFVKPSAPDDLYTACDAILARRMSGQPPSTEDPPV